MTATDTLITIIVVGGLILVIWARVTKQSIPEIVGGIMDAFRDRKDDVVEEVEDRVGVGIYN